jgi:hypothetical protein
MPRWSQPPPTVPTAWSGCDRPGRPGTHGTYRVTRLADRPVCTGPWEEEHHGTPGPCKHALTVVLAEQDIPTDTGAD